MPGHRKTSKKTPARPAKKTRPPDWLPDAMNLAMEGDEAASNEAAIWKAAAKIKPPALSNRRYERFAKAAKAWQTSRARGETP